MVWILEEPLDVIGILFHRVILDSEVVQIRVWVKDFHIDFGKMNGRDIIHCS